MTTHTPGPWHWGHNSASDASTACIEIRPDGPYRGNVADLQSCEHIMGITMAETEANARLIAAAPELLEALIGALKALEAIGDEMTVGERYTNAGEYLIDALMPSRVAIVKATGV